MKTAEEIADKYSHYGKLSNGEDCFVLEYTDTIKAMEEYAKLYLKAKLKEELGAFTVYLRFKKQYLIFIDEVDEYLKQRIGESGRNEIK